MKSVFMVFCLTSLFACKGSHQDVVLEQYHLFVKIDSLDPEKFVVHRCTNDCIGKGHYIDRSADYINEHRRYAVNTMLPLFYRHKKANQKIIDSLEEESSRLYRENFAIFDARGDFLEKEREQKEKK